MEPSWPTAPRKTFFSTPRPSAESLPSIFFRTGLVYCSMMMFMGLAAINEPGESAFRVFGLMIGILLVTTLVNWLSRDGW